MIRRRTLIRRLEQLEQQIRPVEVSNFTDGEGQEWRFVGGPGAFLVVPASPLTVEEWVMQYRSREVLDGTE